MDNKQLRSCHSRRRPDNRSGQGHTHHYGNIQRSECQLRSQCDRERHSKHECLRVKYVRTISQHLRNQQLQANALIRFSDGTVVEDAPYTWSVTFAQNSNIATGTSGDTPIVYTGGGTTYTMAVTLTTKAYYYDSSGNYRKHTTGTSFSHNTAWKP